MLLNRVVFFQLLLLVYHQVTTLVPLYPFNDIERHPLKHRIIESLSNGIFMAISPVGLLLGYWSVVNYAIIYYPILLVGMFFTWWYPYLVKPTATWLKII